MVFHTRPVEEPKEEEYEGEEEEEGVEGKAGSDAEGGVCVRTCTSEWEELWVCFRGGKRLLLFLLFILIFFAVSRLPGKKRLT